MIGNVALISLSPIILKMNALEYPTLTATCMHNSCACTAWLTVYACSISRVFKNYIHTLHLKRVPVLFFSESVHDLRI